MGVVQMHSSCHLGPQRHEDPGPRGHSLEGAGAWGADGGGRRGSRAVPGHGAEILLDENSYYQ